jgi:membrane dipeptidase
MRRRDFNLWLLKAGAASILTSRLRAHAFGDETAPLRELYTRAIVIDSLCAPFSEMEEPATPDGLAAVRQSGITAVNFTSPPSLDFEETVNALATLQKLVEDHAETLLLVRRHSDLARCKREGKLGIMVGFQQPAVLEQAPERIDTFRKLGVRIMQLTYNKRGKFGDGCLEPANAGLTEAGIDAIRLMNRFGVAVDLSHSGYRTMSEAIQRSAKPVLISHSGCAAVYSHPRNTPDEILKSLAEHGGYFGVYLMPYLVSSPTVPTREHVLNHLLHALNVCGTDHVGIGSDGGIQKVVLTDALKAMFDQGMAQRKQTGIAAPGEDRYPYVPDLNGPDHMLMIAEELKKRGQPSSTIEKVLGANFQRVIGETWGGN